MLCRKKYSRLTGKLLTLPVRSYYSDLKINIPDEFDYLYELLMFKEEDNYLEQPTGFRGSRNLWRTPNGDAGKRKVQVINPPPALLIGNRSNGDGEHWLHSVGRNAKDCHNDYVLHPVHVKNSSLEYVKHWKKLINPLFLSIYLWIQRK